MSESFNFDPNIEYIKIYGLQRSGTNFVSEVIEKNFENAYVLVNVGGWKHGHYAANLAFGREVSVIAVAKDPYAWLVSLYNYWGPKRKLNVGPNLTGVSFECFVKNKMLFERQKSVPYIIRAANPVQHWCNMHAHWSSIQMETKQNCLLTYESLLLEPEKTLNVVAKVLNLKRVGAAKIVENVLEPAGEDRKISDTAWKDRSYYLQKKYLSYYTPALIDFVNDQLDIELMIQFGYDYVLPEQL